jgi:amino acid adenylation domain-containing protein
VNLSSEDQSSRRLKCRQIGPTHPFEQFKKEDVEQSIPARFEQQVDKYPARLAVKTKSQTLTYEALNRVSNRTAHAILAGYSGGDEPIALLFRQGASMIAASLGVLKAGRAYVSIDHLLPRAKAIEILQDTQARLILTDNDNLSSTHELAPPRSNVLNVDDLDLHLSDENPRVAVPPDQIAYIYYTSGSTGHPKGVVWNHRNELFGVMLKTNALHISADDRISLLRSNNVGAARDTFLALLNGAALISLEVKAEGLGNLGNWLVEEEITIYSCVATVFRHAVKTLTGDETFPKVRLVHIGGEAISKADIELYKKHFSDECLFVSRYSISETQPVSYYFINKRTEIEGERVPVGYPLDGNEIVLMDEDGEELGLNCVGEIAVKSCYLALGYWRQPELTRAKFLPDPKGGNARVYLTGDLGYKRPDGCLVHVGRKDFQAKIRGHRIEVAEVEMALLGIPGIKQVAVVVRDDPRADKFLVAYVVPQVGQTWTSSELRSLVKDKLPSYMLPVSFVMMASLPLTASGKIDRTALPAPAKSRDASGTSCVAANSPVEKVLAKLWADTMGIDEIGIHDDFSELGGDSLLSAKIVSKVNEVFPLDRLLNTLLETPTVAELSRFVTEHESLPGQAKRIADILLTIENMSAEEIGKALEKDRGARGNER